MAIKWFSGERLTVTTAGETWLPETNEMNIRVGVYGEYAGEKGTGRFGIKEMGNKELIENYYVLKYDNRKDIEGPEGDKYYDITAEVNTEIEKRYFALHSVPVHISEYIRFQEVNWNEFHYDEMAKKLEGAKK